MRRGALRSVGSRSKAVRRPLFTRARTGAGVTCSRPRRAGSTRTSLSDVSAPPVPTGSLPPDDRLDPWFGSAEGPIRSRPAPDEGGGSGDGDEGLSDCRDLFVVADEAAVLHDPG